MMARVTIRFKSSYLPPPTTNAQVTIKYCTALEIHWSLTMPRYKSVSQPVSRSVGLSVSQKKPTMINLPRSRSTSDPVAESTPVHQKLCVLSPMNPIVGGPFHPSDAGPRRGRAKGREGNGGAWRYVRCTSLVKTRDRFPVSLVRIIIIFITYLLPVIDII
ncbi:hypothetical protein GGR50DRAFT_78207 [Xylaria sp. CBS 124048]|nr:hypothetical protein GGR50DRAFT_78207 [Xylaria sp. CBS 124048]